MVVIWVLKLKSIWDGENLLVLIETLKLLPVAQLSHIQNIEGCI